MSTDLVVARVTSTGLFKQFICVRGYLPTFQETSIHVSTLIDLRERQGVVFITFDNRPFLVYE